MPTQKIVPARGFTLIEILVVIGMLAILATVVLVAVNPLRQFAQARNAQREANVNAILNAIGERIADNRGIFEGNGCADLPDETMGVGNTQSTYDLRPCVVPTYLSELPLDPETGMNACVTSDCVGKTYDIGYTVRRDADTARITVCAAGHQEQAIPNSEEFCLTR